MGPTVLLALLLLSLIAGAVVVRRLRGRTRGMSGLDAEADANRWVVRLGGSLSTADVRAGTGADRSAERSLTDATACLHTARGELATARTPAQYTQVTRTAVAGLHHVRTARAALGLAPDPVPPALPEDALRCRTSRPRAGRSPAGPDTARPTAPPRRRRSAVRTAHRHG
jgi:hypothetical protein